MGPMKTCYYKKKLICEFYHYNKKKFQGAQIFIKLKNRCLVKLL